MSFLSQEVIAAHVAGFADVEIDVGIEESLDEEPREPHIQSQHVDGASIDALPSDVQRLLACVVYAGVHDTSLADAQAVLARRNPRPTCSAGTLENFNAGLARAREQMPDWFVSPAELARRATELAELEAARMVDEAEMAPAEVDAGGLTETD